MKKVIALVLSIVMILMLCCACGSPQDGESTDVSVPSNLREVTVSLDNYPLADTIFMYMAKDMGYFAEEGLDVTFVMPGELSPVQMVTEGFSYFGMCTQLDVVSARASGLPVKSIGAVLQSPELLFLTKKGNKIYSPSDLFDKKLGYDGSELQKAMIACMLYGSYRSFMDVDLVNISGMDKAQLLTDGTVEAMLGGSILYDLPLLEEAKVEPDWLKPENYNVPNYYGEVLIASDALIQSEPELIQSFLRACARGYEAMGQNREEAIRCLIRSQDKEHLPITDTLARTTTYTVIPLMKPEEVSFLEQSDERWQEVISWMVRWNLITPGLTVDECRVVFS